MTGFGRASVDADGVRASVEVRSVNQRFLRIGIKLPSAYSALEQRAREVLEAGKRRGQIDCVASISDGGTAGTALPSVERVKAYVERWRSITRALELPGEVDVGTLAAMPQMFVDEGGAEVVERAWEALKSALAGALEALDQMRAIEGERLRAELSSRVDTLDKGAREIAPLAEEARLEYARKLRERVEGVLREFGTDLEGAVSRPNLEREIAVYADRTDVSEEMQRIASHVDQFRSTLSGGSPAGRKLEFLVQELQREISTLGAKVGDARAGCQAVELKSELEKIREQVQNVE